ncbi:MAG: carboxypeptidase regulatory-like domain-containing protein [Candidatus Marinimicrobia bacterium]|jgi:hypothetical protein|nr:carboxypeptidase regulatory-like domain-containing protein [Candidatus Neomarinimicrobiota bacterium]
MLKKIIPICVMVFGILSVSMIMLPSEIVFAQTIPLAQIDQFEFAILTDNPVSVDFNSFSTGNHFFTSNTPSNRNHLGLQFYGAQYTPLPQFSAGGIGNYDVYTIFANGDRGLRLEQSEIIKFPSEPQTVLLETVGYGPVTITAKIIQGGNTITRDVNVLYSNGNYGQKQFIGFADARGIEEVIIANIDGPPDLDFLGLAEVQYGDFKHFSLTGNVLSNCISPYSQNNMLVSGATITINDANGLTVGNVLSNSDGSFVWNGLPGAYTATINRAGFVSSNVITFSFPSDQNIGNVILDSLTTCPGLVVIDPILPCTAWWCMLCLNPLTCSASNEDSTPFEFVIIPIIVIVMSIVVGFYSMKKNPNKPQR